MTEIEATRIASASLVLMFLLVGFFILPVAIAREERRQDAVRAWNCQHYGDAINTHYGREICPPTERG